MAIGKKESKTVNLSGTYAETTQYQVGVLNYAKFRQGGYVDITGTYTVTVRIYGTLDVDKVGGPRWVQIGSDIVISADGAITNQDITDPYDALKVTLQGAGTGSAVVTLEAVRRRHS